MSADLSPMLGRTLVLVAHPDDEAAGCSVLLQRMREPVVLFCTDGAPRDEYFWRPHGSRAAYAELRRCEARAALDRVGVSQLEFLDSPPTSDLFIDQELFRCLAPAAERIAAVLDRLQPEALLTPAYEGGHPDHDSCALLTSVLGRERRIPLWEFPLYHREPAGQIRMLEFLAESGTEIRLQPSAEELGRKRAMFDAYSSQGEVLSSFDPAREVFRPMAAYDFTQPPHPGRTNYEIWKWRMSAAEVTAAFRAWLATKQSGRTRPTSA